MKPEHLKSPFSWQDRQITIKDRIFYVPDQLESYESFRFPGWQHPDVFAKDLPIRIEYCSGNGAWIAAKAKEDSQSNWVAIEKRFVRVRKIWSKLKNENLDNLFVVCGEGYRTTQLYFPSSSVAEVFINFPDPWPKKRHAKHRIVQPHFVQEVWRILKEGCLFTLVTDDAVYSSIMIEVLKGCKGFEPCFPDPHFVTDFPGYGTSYFEDLWRSKGKAIHYHQFRKVVS
jgi:tRNA (guanine-N7-)-methyltransferase